jgi:hypothetical protein
MIVSHAKKFILMSPWKTASSTCHESLKEYDDGSYSRFFHFNPRLMRVVHQHLTLADLMALPEGRLGYKLCAFVRNPYDRAYSGFRQIQRDFQDQPKFRLQPAWVSDLLRAQIAGNMAKIIEAGFDFDAWIQNLPEYEIYEAGRNSNMVLHPSHYWTHCPETQADFVGKVESFETDFARFCSYVGIEAPAIVSANVSEDRGEQLALGGSKYAARMSRRSIDRINYLFAEDFELFGYERL